MRNESSLSSSRECGHSLVRHNICLACKTKVSGLHGQAFNYLFPGLCLSHETVSFTKRLTTLISLNKHKKLHLVLDLDHTLIHAVKASYLSQADKHLIEGSRENLGKFEDFLIKFRPFLNEFLEEANKLFNMYIYTKASSDYGQAVARMIDPSRIYFGDRVITSQESPHTKTLDLVLADERATVIVDDKLDVWPHHKRNLLHIKAYRYFKRDAATIERKRDESRTSKRGLASVLRFLKEVHNEFFRCDLQQELYSKDVRSLIKGPFTPHGC